MTAPIKNGDICSFAIDNFALSAEQNKKALRYIVTQIGDLMLSFYPNKSIGQTVSTANSVNDEDEDIQTIKSPLSSQLDLNRYDHLENLLKSAKVHVRMSAMLVLMKNIFWKTQMQMIQDMGHEVSTTFSVKKRACFLSVSYEEFRLIHEQLVQKTKSSGETTFFKIRTQMHTHLSNLLPNSKKISQIKIFFTKECVSELEAVQQRMQVTYFKNTSLIKEPPTEQEIEFYQLQQRLQDWAQEDDERTTCMYKLLDCFLTKSKEIILEKKHLSGFFLEIRQFSFLSQLDLSAMQLTSTYEVAQLKNLDGLILDGNGLDSLHPEMAQLTSLTKLSLNTNQFEVVPDCVPGFTKLRALMLSNNRLQEIPPSFSQLNCLTELYLDGNRLESLPETLKNLSASLRALNLSNNAFHSFPPVITDLTSLRELFLNNNPIQELPDTIDNLTSLQRLELANTELRFIYKIANLRELKTLNLKNNPLQPSYTIEHIINSHSSDHERVDYETFQSIKTAYAKGEIDRKMEFSIYQPIDCLEELISLTYLDLEDCQLGIYPKSLDNLTSLTSLNLKNNQLKSFPSTIGATALTELNLEKNALTAFPRAIIELNSLIKLDLSDNQITKFPEKVLKLSAKLNISMSGNPFSSPFINILLYELAKPNYRGPQFTLMPQDFDDYTQTT